MEIYWTIEYITGVWIIVKIVGSRSAESQKYENIAFTCLSVNFLSAKVWSKGDNTYVVATDLLLLLIVTKFSVKSQKYSDNRPLCPLCSISLSLSLSLSLSPSLFLTPFKGLGQSRSNFDHLFRESNFFLSGFSKQVLNNIFRL